MTTWGAHRPGIVYYVLAERDAEPAIKIGITQDLHQRMGQYPRGKLLAFHPGSGAVENDLNERFAADALGNEWFRPSHGLLLHIARLPRLAVPKRRVRPEPPARDPEMVEL